MINKIWVNNIQQCNMLKSQF